MGKDNTSPVWRLFPDMNATHATCSLCGTQISRNGGTSNLRGHMKAKHMAAFAAIDHRNQSARIRGVGGAANVEAEDMKRLAKFIAKDLQPFSMVEDTGFRSFISYGMPDFQIPSRKHVSKTLIPNLCAEVREKLKEVLQGVKDIASTTDLWTSRTQTPYLSVTAHFLSKDEEELRVVLDSIPVPGSHTATRIADDIGDILDQWGCRGKVTSVTTDNGANVVAAVNLLGYKHLPCVAHTLHLVVMDAINECALVKTTIEDCKAIVTFFKSSNVASESLTAFLTSLGQHNLKLINSVATRWNSTLDMLERITEVCDALAMAQLRNSNAPLILEGSQLSLIADMIAALKPFKTATVVMSGEQYPTASLVVPMIQGLFTELTKVQGTVLTDTGKAFAAAFHNSCVRRLCQYESVKVTRLCTLLDPRLKKYGFRIESHYDDAYRQVLAELRANLNVPAPPPVQQPARNDDEPIFGGLLSCVWQRFEEGRSLATTTSSATVAIDQYVKRVNLKNTDSTVKYWAKNTIDVTELAKLERKYLIIPATSVPSERVFSAAGNIISDKRCRLSPVKATQLIFLHQNEWLY